jgi:hypothetical protein
LDGLDFNGGEQRIIGVESSARKLVGSVFILALSEESEVDVVSNVVHEVALRLSEEGNIDVNVVVLSGVFEIVWYFNSVELLSNSNLILEI